MMSLPANTRVRIVVGHTYMSKYFDGLAVLVKTALSENPFSGHVFIFCGRRGEIIKGLWFDDQGLLLLSKRLERGCFVLRQASSGGLSLTLAQLSMLPKRTLTRYDCAISDRTARYPCSQASQWGFLRWL